MIFNLKSDAINNFNEKAEVLLSKLDIKSPSKHPKSPFHPEFYIASEITEKDIIGDIKGSALDIEGNEVGLFYLHNGKEIGLFNESYKDLVKLSQSMQKTKALYPIASFSFLKNNIFEWIKYKYLDEIHTSMLDYIIDKCRKEVREYQVWIPIPGISVQSDFKIGKIILKSISKETIDLWFANWDEKTKIDYITKEKKESHGHAAATIKLNAEPERAVEIAFNETDKAISILRIFSPANLSPRLLSYCTLSGNRNLERRKYFLGNNEQVLNIFDGFIDINRYHSMVLSDKTLTMIRDMGLDILSDISCKDDRKEFQDQVLTSLFLYSRNTLAKEISDRLVYILVSLESILLKDSSEPLMQNIGDRMAYLIGAPERRKEIVENVKDVYKLRSSFIHHGKDISYDDIEVIRQFMRNSWEVYQFIIHNIYKFEFKAEFIEYIDKIKYGLI